MLGEERLREVVERGKCAPLYRYLRARSGRQWRVSFADVEAVLGFALPESARLRRSWWSNRRSSRRYAHSLAWQLAGWRTAAVDLEHESLVFERGETISGEALPHRSGDRASGNAIDLDHVFPPHNPGDWPAGLSLRREDLYHDRGC